MKNIKVSKHPKVSFWDEWVRLFSNLRLLFLRFVKTQNSSDITSKFRSVEKIIGWIYIENLISDEK